MTVILEEKDLVELQYLLENLPRASNPTTDRIINIINSKIVKDEKPNTPISSNNP